MIASRSHANYANRQMTRMDWKRSKHSLLRVIRAKNPNFPEAMEPYLQDIVKLIALC